MTVALTSNVSVNMKRHFINRGYNFVAGVEVKDGRGH